MKKLILIASYLIGSSIIFSTSTLTAQQSEPELAKATQNSLAAMYSVPFQNNTTYGNPGLNCNFYFQESKCLLKRALFMAV